MITTAFRRTWDAFIFYTILKNRAKIPSSDTFIARRVEGPGIALDYFVQVFLKRNIRNKYLLMYLKKAKPEQILAALEVDIEIKIINSYLEKIHRILEKPKTDYK